MCVCSPLTQSLSAVCFLSEYLLEYFVFSSNSHKTYEVRIRGASVKQDHISWGNFSAPLRFTTLKDLPGAVPTGVNVIDLEPGIQVTWIPIPPEYENGDLSNYVLTYKLQNSDQLTDVVIPIKRTLAVVNDLLPWRIYEVSLVLVVRVDL